MSPADLANKLEAIVYNARNAAYDAHQIDPNTITVAFELGHLRGSLLALMLQLRAEAAAAAEVR